MIHLCMFLLMFGIHAGPHQHPHQAHRHGHAVLVGCRIDTGCTERPVTW